VLVLAALAGFTGVARSAIQGGGLTHAQQLTVERNERRAALQAEREAARQAKREARRQADAQKAVEMEKHKERDTGGGHIAVKSVCTTVTIAFSGFQDTGAHNLREGITIMRNHGKEAIRMPLRFSFNGTGAMQVIDLPVFLGRYIIDVQASWPTGHFDVGANVECGPTPKLSIEKLERLGEAGEYAKGPLTGHVGETVDYAIIVRNTGNVPLTLSNLEDPNCGAITPENPKIASGEIPLAAGASTKLTCTHQLTEADLQTTPYTNIAHVTGTPPEGDGSPLEKVPSNTVEVGVSPPAPPSGPPSGPGTTTGSGNAVAGTQFIGGPIGSPGAGAGVLTFVQSTPPSLRGPQGCVRNTFKATLRSKGVATVAFYVDGHKLRTMTARSARRGVFTISINISRLKVGAHRLTAKILMAKAAASSKQVRASRSLTFVHCASAAVRPKFTG
jgi:hypothetical protein